MFNNGISFLTISEFLKAKSLTKFSSISLSIKRKRFERTLKIYYDLCGYYC